MAWRTLEAPSCFETQPSPAPQHEGCGGALQAGLPAVIILVFTVLLYAVAAAMLGAAARHRDGRAKAAAVEAWGDFLRLIPRLAVGVIGSGYLARALPQDIVVSLLGPKSGIAGLVIACVSGALTPGGPVVGYSLGSAAIKAGAGLPQIVAYVTAWSLYTFNRVLIWELPIMPKRFVWLRLLVSLPLPFLAAGLIMVWEG